TLSSTSQRTAPPQHRLAAALTLHRSLEPQHRHARPHHPTRCRLRRDCASSPRSSAVCIDRGGYPGKTSAADFSERATGTEFAITDPVSGSSEYSGADDRAIPQGLGQHRSRGCLAATGKRADREAGFLLLRKRRFLFNAEALARKP